MHELLCLINVRTVADWCRVLDIIVPTRVGGLPLIPEHQEEFKLKGEATIFNEPRGVLKSEEALLTSV